MGKTIATFNFTSSATEANFPGTIVAKTGTIASVEKHPIIILRFNLNAYELSPVRREFIQGMKNLREKERLLCYVDLVEDGPNNTCYLDVRMTRNFLVILLNNVMVGIDAKGVSPEILQHIFAKFRERGILVRITQEPIYLPFF